MGKKTMNNNDAAAKSRLTLEKFLREGETWRQMWRRLAFEESPVGMAVIDRRLRLIKANKSFCQQSGYTEKELTGNPLGNLVNPDDLRATSGNREGMVQGRIRRAYVEKRFTAKNGETGWVGVTVNTVRDARGKFLCFLAAVENITERKRAEAALRESEERLRLTFDESPLSMALIDRRLRFVKANKTFYRNTGFTEKNLKEHSLGELVPPEDLRKTKDERDLLVQGRKNKFCVEVRNKTPGGEDAWMAVTVSTVRGAHGEFLYFLATAENITKRKRAEAALCASEEKFRLSFEKNLTGMGMVDKNFRFLKANRALCRLLGYTEKELSKRSLGDVTHPDDLSQDRLNMKRILLEGLNRYRVEKRFIRKNGEVVWVAVTVTVVRDKRGKLLHILGVVEDITQRKRAEEAVLASEERFRLAFEKGPVGMVLCDRERRIIRANDTFCRLLGYSREELLRRTFMELTHPDHIGADVNNVAKLMRGKIPQYRTEKRYLRKDGTAVWALTTVSAIRDERGAFNSFLTFVEDITDRKSAEEALRASEERFRLSFEKGPVGMVLTGRDKKLIRVNDAFCRLLGYPKEELLGRSFEDVTHPDHVDENTEGAKRLFRGEIPQYRAEKRYLRKDGGTVWASVTVSVLRDDRGRFISFLTFIEDITERRRAEEAQRASEERFRLAFEENRVGMGMVDREHRYIKVNRAYCRMLGYTEKELMRMKLSDVTHPDDFPRERKKLEQVGQGKRSGYQIEKRYIAKNGETIWGSLSVSVIRDKQGKFLCAMGSVENITERKRAEEALRENEERFRLSFEEHTVGMAMLGRDLRYIRANAAYCRMMGYTENELKKMRVSDLTYPDDFSEERENLEKMAQGKLPRFQVEKRYIRKNGETLWASLTVSAIRDKQGKFICTMGIVENITERKRAEAALLESEQRYRAFFENSIEGVLLTTPDGEIQAANPEACRIFGMSEKELKRAGREGIIDKTDPMIPFSLKEKERVGRFKGEVRFKRRDGTVFPAEIATSRYTDPDGRERSTLILRDITERRGAEEALRESEQRYRSIFENAPFGIFHSTIEGKIVNVNQTYARQLGYSSPRECIDTINRKGVAECLYVHPERRQRFVRKTLMLGGWQQFENLYKRKDGKTMPGLLRFRAMPMDSVTGADLEGFVEDLSTRKQAEEKVRLYQEKLRDLSLQLAFVEEKERQRLANNIHDYIGQSLSCAMLALGALEREMPRTPKAREALRKVRGQIEEGIRHARSVTFELSPAILFKLGFEAVVEWLSDRLLAANNIRFRITGDRSLKLPDNEVRVILYRAVRELLMNVVKHSKAREVRIDLRKNKGCIEITVRDDGRGFDILLLQKKTEGFGLFSVREQLMYVGGRMSIVSKPDRGSVVTIIFPLGRSGRNKGVPMADREEETYA